MSDSSGRPTAIVRAVSTITGIVVALTFLFGFGNVLDVALRLGVPGWVAPLIAPAVDLSILALLLGIRHLALSGASIEVLRPARRLLLFASLVTLALNIAGPLIAGEYGKAAFDAVGPFLLIGWAEVGPGFLQAIGTSCPPETAARVSTGVEQEAEEPSAAVAHAEVVRTESGLSEVARRVSGDRSAGVFLEQARQEDAAHRAVYQRHISADTLRVRLGIGAALARRLVKTVRAEFQESVAERLG